MLGRDPGRPGRRPQLVEPVQPVDRHVPPVGVVPDDPEGAGPGPADDHRDRPERRRLLPGAVDVEVRPVMHDRAAAPQGPHHGEALLQAGHPGRGAVAGHPVRHQLVGHRAPPEGQLEPPARRVVEGHGLAGQDGGVAEGVAQHEVADDQLGRPGGHPGGQRHRLVHGRALGPRRRQVVHEGDAAEPAPLGGPCPFADGLHVHPHLGEVEEEFRTAHRSPRSGSAFPVRDTLAG